MYVFVNSLRSQFVLMISRNKIPQKFQYLTVFPKLPSTTMPVCSGTILSQVDTHLHVNALRSPFLMIVWFGGAPICTYI